MIPRSVLTIFFILVGAALNAQGRKIALDVNRQPLPLVLEQIQKRSRYNIIYSDEVVSDTMLVTLQTGKRPVSEILQTVLGPKDLFYLLRNNDMIVIGSNVLRKQGFSMAFAQSRISGRVVDETGLPIPFATVALSDGKRLLTNMAGSENGQFEFTFPLIVDSSYRISVSSVGFSPQEIRFTYPDADDLKRIVLIKDKGTLAAVTVTTEKPLVERKVDRLVFNVENSIGILGGDAMDALRITPTLLVKADMITIIGKSSVRVMVNDKIIPLSGDALVSYLKSIPAAAIQRIEVIATPPSKYDAEGNSGLVNIVLKQAKENSWNTTLRAAYTQATYAAASEGASFSYRRNKFALLTNVSFRSGKELYTNNIFYHYPTELWHNQVDNREKTKTISTLLNMQYSLTPKKTIGFQYSDGFSNESRLEHNNSQSFYNNQLLKDYPSNGISSSKPQHLSFNINYSQKLDTLGKNFSVDADYFKMQSPRNNGFTSYLNDLQNDTTAYLLAQNNSLQHIQNYSFKTDFIMPYKWVNAEFGAKITSTQSINNVSADFFDDPAKTQLSLSQKDSFLYQENLQALYLSLHKKISSRLEVKAGLRSEYTQTRSNSITTDSIVNRSYFKLFPTAYLLYKPDAKNAFNLTFSRRISRPGFGYLNPARWYLNARSYAVGNPFLQPSFTNNFSLAYNYKNKLNIEAYYSKKTDGYSQVTYHDTINDYQVFRRLNFYNIKNWGITANLSLKPAGWWESYSTAYYSWSATENFIPIIDKYYRGYAGGFFTNNTVTLNHSKTFFSSIYFNYNLPSSNNYYITTSSWTLDIGFKYLLLDKRLVLGLNADDIFRKNYATIKTVSQGIAQSFTQYYDTRQLRLSISYNFGNKNISVSSRKAGNQDEQNRSGN